MQLNICQYSLISLYNKRMIIIKLYDLVWRHKVRGYQIAEATGLSTATISKLMQGENIDVKLSTINKLCEFFKCDLSDLIEYVSDENS